MIIIMCIIYTGFEALHGEVSMYILFVSTCQVDYVHLRTCLALHSTTAE